MKQGKTLQELGKELQRQRLHRQDFLADTRSLEVESNNYSSARPCTCRSTARLTALESGNWLISR